MDSDWYNDICQDSDNYLWIASYYGLYRFDGNTFKAYHHNQEDNSTLCNDMVRALLSDRSGRLWIGTANGLQYYRSEYDDFVSISFPGYGSVHVLDICQMKNGAIRVVVSDIGIFEVDINTLSASILNGDIYSGRYFTTIYEDSSGNIWLGTDRIGVVRINSDNGKCIWYSNNENNLKKNIEDFIEDTSGRIIIAAHDGAFVWNPVKDTLEKLNSGQSTNLSFCSTFLSDDGSVWLGTNGNGLWSISKDERSVNQLSGINTSDININKARVNTIFKDNNGNIWLGCGYQGILTIFPNNMPFHFWDFSINRNVESGEMRALYSDKGGQIWGSVEERGIYKFGINGSVELHIEAPPTVSSLYEDSKGRLLAGTSDGLFMIDETNERLVPLHDITDLAVQDIAESDDGMFYFALSGVGLMKYDPKIGSKEIFTSDSTEKGKLASNWANKLIIDSRGLVWTCHYGGVSYYDPQKDHISIVGESVLSESICSSILEGNNGIIWIGTNIGLFAYNPNSEVLNKYTSQDGLSNDYITGILEDSKGNIWCSTMRGISCFNPKKCDALNYYSGNGLESKIYSSGIYMKDPSGNLYFGSSRGITSFNPNNINLTGTKSSPRITEILINGGKNVNLNTLSGHKPILKERLADASDIRLKYTDNTITLVLSTLDFRESGNIIYEYRINSGRGVWNRTQPEVNFITLNDLRAGRYVLEVRTIEYDTYSDSKFVNITIISPWYASIIAKIFYVIAAICLFYLFLRELSRKRKEEESEAKLQFFINLSHDIRSPLTLILNPLEHLMSKSNDVECNNALNTIYRNTQRIINLLNQMMDMRKIDKGHLTLHCCETNIVDYATSILNLYEYQAKEKNINLYITRTEPKINIWIDRSYFDKVITNLLSNAFRFTPDGGEIAICLSIGNDKKIFNNKDGYVEISVKDTGIGLKDTSIDKIFDRFYQGKNSRNQQMGYGIGLNFSRSIVLLHHGTITARNRQNGYEGSCFTIRIPMGKKHLKEEEILSDSNTQQALSARNDNDTLLGSSPKKIVPKTSFKVLVIDDDIEICTYLINEFSETYTTYTANNGYDGLKKATEVNPDIIISDVIMPQMDGITMLRRLKSNSSTSHIPIILLSSKSEIDDRISGLSKGADSYITKPFNKQELMAVIANLLSNRRILKGKYSGMQDKYEEIKLNKIKSEDEKLMERVTEVMSKNLDNSSFTVEWLAGEVGLSRVQLHRRLKAITGCTSSDFIRNIRLNKAVEMLKEGTASIAAVGYAVGFSSTSHFSSTFKSVYGMSPSEYIEKFANKNLDKNDS